LAWNEQRRIGSLTEIVEFAIRSKLQPRTGRDEYSLSEAEAREGAEWLAAATVFARQFTFRIPDDTWQSVGGLDPRAFLPASWRPDACRALLMRALFDGASYGRSPQHR
jgi:hypothetical protein